MTAPRGWPMGLTLAATVLTAPVLAQQRPGPADPAKATRGAVIGREVGESLARGGVKPPNPN